MELAAALFWRLLPYLLGAALLTGGWLYADRACWSSACKSARAEVTTLKAEKAAAQERALQIQLDMNQAAEEANENASKERAARDKEFAALAARAAAGLRTTPDLRLSERGIGLLLDASRLANSAPAAAGVEAPADPVPRSAGVSEAELEAKWRAAAEAYADVDGLRQGLIDYYESLQRRKNGPH